MPTIVHEHELPVTSKKLPAPDRQRWKAKCQNCSFEKKDLETGNGAETVALAHCLVHGHDVDWSFSVIDCPGGTVRANDPRD